MRFPILSTTLLALSLLALSPAHAEPPQPHIAVTGEGRRDSPPDMALISFGVITEADEAGQALAQNSKEMARVIAYLGDAGLDDRDIQTSGLSLNPRYSNETSSGQSGPAITGFFASNMVTVRVRSLDRLGEILDAVVSEGANSFQGLSFGLQDPQAAVDAARLAAVADARRRAELLAQAAGVTLGAVHSITDSPGMAQPLGALREASFARDGAVPVAGGEVSMTASVTVVFNLVE